MLRLNIRYYFFLFIFSLLICSNVWARGGGCFEQGTVISTPKGFIPIEKLKIGDQIYSRQRDKTRLANVVATTKITPHKFLAIKLTRGELHVTEEHLIAIKLGIYRRAANLSLKDKVIVWRNNKWQSMQVIKISHLYLSHPAYNLLVDDGSTYLANNVLVHNKGCFLPETPILLSNGKNMAISQIQPGVRVQAYEPGSDKLIKTTVRNVIKHRVNSYYIVTTDKVVLNVTGEHPFYIGNGLFKTVETLSTGEVIYGYSNNTLNKQRIIGIEHVNTATIVYNLQTDMPHTYFASGIAVHNKGGGGGGGHSSGHNNGNVSYFEFISLIIIACFISFTSRKNKNNNESDYLYSRAVIENKSIKTKKLLFELAKQDKNMNPDALTKRVSEIFMKLQACWVNRDYTPMKTYLMPDIFKQHLRKIQKMIKCHEINKLDKLHIDKIDLVYVRYIQQESIREFTALITATVADYYVDDKTNKLLRGSLSEKPFQEFWIFELKPEGWLLKEIEQTLESDFLRKNNYVEL